MSVAPVDGCVIDLDGTLYTAGAAVPGAADAIRTLRAAAIPLVFATNTTRRPRTMLVASLAAMGIVIAPDELFTAPVVAARWLASVGARRLSLLLPTVTHAEFEGFELDRDNPDHVVVGDLGEAWSYAVLDRAFRALTAGAVLVAIQKNRAWDPGDGLRLDAGPFVAALEYAAQVEAVLVGKPSQAFFTTAAAALGVPIARVAVVGDGLETDVAGAQAVGALGVAVRTGAFRAEQLGRLAAPPAVVLDSIAELPRWLGL